jgi:signal transduction histidine kinase
MYSIKKLINETPLKRSELISKLKLAHLNNLQLLGDLQKAKKFNQILYIEYENDRKRISNELHDEVAQILTAINFELALVRKHASKGASEFEKRIISTQKMVEQSVTIINNFSQKLRPRVLDDLGLIPALKNLLNDFILTTNISVTLKTFSQISKLNDFHKTILFRVAEEALKNIAKHAKAKNVSIIIAKNKNIVQLSIHDDGISFNVKSKKSKPNINQRGLLTMEERIKIANGTFNITSSPKNGTLLKAELNLSKKNFIK